MDFHSTQLADAVAQHGIDEFPKEAVGFVDQDERYVRLENTHKEPERHFLVAQYPRDAQAIIHTHTQQERDERGCFFVSAAPSYGDMQTQQTTGLPWGIMPMQANGRAAPMEWFGDQSPILPLLGRQFRSGSADCFCLVRDFHRLQWGVDDIPNLPRDNDWFKNPDPAFDLMSLERIEIANFQVIDQSQARPGDVVLGMIRSRRNNHSGLICPRGLVLHQMEGQLSRREPLNPWLRYIKLFVRHKQSEEWDGVLPTPE